MRLQQKTFNTIKKKKTMCLIFVLTEWTFSGLLEISYIHLDSSKILIYILW